MTTNGKHTLFAGLTTLLASMIPLLAGPSPVAYRWIVISFLLIGGIVPLGFSILLATDHIMIRSRHDHSRYAPSTKIDKLVEYPGLAASLCAAAGTLALTCALGLFLEGNSQSQQVNVVVNCPSADDIAMTLQKELTGRIEGPGYDVTPLASDRLVGELQGSYYIVDLRSATSNAVWRFEEGEYTIDSFEREFGRSIGSFVRDVVRPLSGIADYRLFVRGSADQDAGNDFKRELKPDSLFNEVSFLPAITREQYGGAPRPRRIQDPYTNRDLPFLRAAFMQEKLSISTWGLRPAVILEGEVVPIADEDLRNATVFLFVDWPARNNPSLKK